jgi:hypothetical protein
MPLVVINDDSQVGRFIFQVQAERLTIVNAQDTGVRTIDQLDDRMEIRCLLNVSQCLVNRSQWRGKCLHLIPSRVNVGDWFCWLCRSPPVVSIDHVFDRFASGRIDYEHPLIVKAFRLHRSLKAERHHPGAVFLFARAKLCGGSFVIRVL